MPPSGSVVEAADFTAALGASVLNVAIALGEAATAALAVRLTAVGMGGLGGADFTAAGGGLAHPDSRTKSGIIKCFTSG